MKQMRFDSACKRFAGKIVITAGYYCKLKLV